MKQYSELYKKELLESIVPFWERHSKDDTYGGYLTCLGRYGEPFDTDKFIWLQAREVFSFSMLYNKVEPKDNWLEMARHGARFLQQHGRDADGNWYFSTNQKGAPLVQPYNIFSDCFAALAFGALYKADPQEEYAALAIDTFQNILARRDNPKGPYNKTYPGTRNLRNFSLPMILCNLSLEMEHLLPSGQVAPLIQEVVHEVMDVFYDEEHGLIRENVGADGRFISCFEGRLLNPGHAIEAMWFIMDLAVRLDDPQLLEKAIGIALRTIEYGWDVDYGGIFYFMDIEQKPPQQLEWDQKLWWVHMEALVCMAKAYAYTGNEQAKAWFERVHDYCWRHFRDPEYLEWFGYLNRRGEVLLPLKGGKWKGCFHTLRSLYQVWQALNNQAGATEKS